jgi:uncharacterized membrane protein
MSFANPLPWWALGLIILAAAAVAWQAYRLPGIPPAIRLTLSALRFVALMLLVVILMRPVARITEREVSNLIVPVLVDVSRSMGVEDAGGERRMEYARRLLTDRLLPALDARFTVELLSFGESVQHTEVSALSAVARQSDLDGALAAVAERYRGRPIAGVVLLSDGGDTTPAQHTNAAYAAPVFPIGIGSPAITRDREVLSVTVAESVLDDSRVNLAVSAVSHGSRTEPFDLRLLQNGRSVQVRRVSPIADGSPVHEVFQVTPPPGNPAVYTVEIPSAQDELVPENNARSVLVQRPARPRRILLLEGAPGFEHSFIKRAWGADKELEIDSVVRNGRNEQGRDTFDIQAAESRSVSLRTGYPERTEDLFQYDAIVLANVSGHQLTRAQLDATRAFVSQRGGGLLVLGAQSFVRQGLMDTPVEEVLPLDLSDRASAVLPASRAGGLNRVTLTSDGENHPIMQIGAGSDESRKRWEDVPALASVAALGGPRPGATVLAVTSGPGGAPRALVAVQRFGEGRSMVFTGEAAWRWRMMLPATDRSFDTFWRQAIRWLALPATDPVALSLPSAVMPGESSPISVAVRDASFQSLRDAAVVVRVTGPDGRVEELPAAQDPAQSSGVYAAQFRPSQAGIHRVTAEARLGGSVAGTASASLLVGGADPEMTDPRMNAQVLERLALASGGQMMAPDGVDALVDRLVQNAPAAMLSVRRDLWHNGWSLLAIIALLSGEWVLRRKWGLR